MRLSLPLALGASVLTIVSMSAGAVGDSDNNASIHGIINGTYQAATESSADGEDVNGDPSATFYLMGTLDMGPGAWHLEARGATSPADNGVAQHYASNALVGETLDSDGDGRIAATQFFYELPAGSGKFRAGLLDPTALLDANSVAGDEYTQFLADSFVNNPSIAFPSFVLGGAYQGRVNNRVSYKLFLGSDSGLEDERDPTYGNVFDLNGDRGRYDKGAFTTAELDWHANGYALKGGLWYDTGDVARLGRMNSTENGYGVYALAGAPMGSGRVQWRGGVANDKAQAAANFISLAYQLPIQLQQHDSVLGVAFARTGDSDHLAYSSDPIYQVEAYWRINAMGPLYVSPDIQYIDNADFRSDRDGVLVGGARIGVEF